MMKATRFLFICLTTVIIADEMTAEDHQLKVSVYDGPTKCDEVDRVKVADNIGMYFTGTIDGSSRTGETGKEFHSSRDSDLPLYLTIGVGELIEGWDVGLLGICRGAKVILVVPPQMAYGSNGFGDLIPGDATLRFDVEIVSVTAPPPEPDLFGELDVDHDGVLTPEEIHAHFKKEGLDAEMPPDLMAKEDTNGDGIVSRKEFGGPKMPWDMCLEMLHPHRDSKPTTHGLAVQWICQRPRDLEDEGNDNERSEEL